MVKVCLHHIGILVGSIPEAAAVYSERHGYQVRSEIIHDPTQTAYVQFLQLPGDPCYIEFVSPDGPESKLTNGLHKGGGLNHVAYATDQIERTCEHMLEQGTVLVWPHAAADAYGGLRLD